MTPVRLAVLSTSQESREFIRRGRYKPLKPFGGCTSSTDVVFSEDPQVAASQKSCIERIGSLITEVALFVQPKSQDKERNSIQAKVYPCIQFMKQGSNTLISLPNYWRPTREKDTIQLHITTIFTPSYQNNTFFKPVKIWTETVLNSLKENDPVYLLIYGGKCFDNATDGSLEGTIKDVVEVVFVKIRRIQEELQFELSSRNNTNMVDKYSTFPATLAAFVNYEQQLYLLGIPKEISPSGDGKSAIKGKCTRVPDFSQRFFKNLESEFKNKGSIVTPDSKEKKQVE